MSADEAKGDRGKIPGEKGEGGCDLQPSHFPFSLRARAGRWYQGACQVGASR